MQTTEKPQQKQVKILKSTKCGKEYIYDSASRRCPQCGGTLQVQPGLR